MARKPVLVVMAAGMGSRYGGLKQIDPVGSCGEAILDYSLYDAHEAGFEAAVIIIKEAIRKDFMETVGARLKKCPMEIRYAYQELDALPEGYALPEGRTKPWGTCHAVLCGRDAIGGAPFAVINADDYYGKAAFKEVYRYLSQVQEPQAYCMVGFRLDMTVTDNGAVTRGVCVINENRMLTKVDELTRVEKYPGGIRYTLDGEHYTDLPGDSIVSMNMWGFQPDFLEKLEAGFPAFLDKALAENPMKGEYLLPLKVDQLLQAGAISVKVLSTPDQWFGVTYAPDKPVIVAALRQKTEAGLYPDGLWK